MHFGLLADGERETGVVEHDGDLGDLGLELGDGVGYHLGEVEFGAGLLVGVVFLF